MITLFCCCRAYCNQHLAFSFQLLSFQTPVINLSGALQMTSPFMSRTFNLKMRFLCILFKSMSGSTFWGLYRKARFLAELDNWYPSLHELHLPSLNLNTLNLTSDLAKQEIQLPRGPCTAAHCVLWYLISSLWLFE